MHCLRHSDTGNVGNLAMAPHGRVHPTRRRLAQRRAYSIPKLEAICDPQVGQGKSHRLSVFAYLEQLRIRLCPLPPAARCGRFLDRASRPSGSPVPSWALRSREPMYFVRAGAESPHVWSIVSVPGSGESGYWTAQESQTLLRPARHSLACRFRRAAPRAPRGTRPGRTPCLVNPRFHLPSCNPSVWGWPVALAWSPQR